MSYTLNKRDKNEREIVDFWRSIGALWKPQGRMAGLDGFLLYGGAWYPVEIKQPGKLLTQAERECRELIEDAGGEYHVIHSVREAAELLGLEIRADVTAFFDTERQYIDKYIHLGVQRKQEAKE